MANTKKKGLSRRVKQVSFSPDVYDYVLFLIENSENMSATVDSAVAESPGYQKYMKEKKDA